MSKLTTKMLQRAASISAQHQAIQGQLTDAFNERYGCTYSDIDADPLIDVLDYGGGHITLEMADEAMTNRGHPPLRNRTATQETT